MDNYEMREGRSGSRRRSIRKENKRRERVRQFGKLEVTTFGMEAWKWRNTGISSWMDMKEYDWNDRAEGLTMIGDEVV